MNKKIIIFLIVIGIISVLVGGVLYYYESSLDSVNKTNKSSSKSESEEVIFHIETGESTKAIIHNLYEANLIKNEKTALIYLKFNENVNFQAGTYALNRNMKIEDIFYKFNSGDTTREEIQITFNEGKNIPKYVKLISEGFDLSEEEIYGKINDVSFLKELISKYWFLTDDILNEGIYYPLEGYLYPDTYLFNKNTTIENIIVKLLDNTSIKLEPYKEAMEKSSYSIHELMTIASISELEGNDSESRHSISQVIYSRLNAGWSLGMDVTAFYGVKKDLNDVLYQKDLDDINPYNTRISDGSMAGKLPIGPIGNPSIDSIHAAIKPNKGSYYYFVANVCTGEVFFQENEFDFYNKVRELQNECELN